MVYLYDAHGNVLDSNASWKSPSDFMISNQIARTYIQTYSQMKATISTVHLGRGKTIESPDVKPRLFEIAYSFQNAEALGLPDPQPWIIVARYKSWDSALRRHIALRNMMIEAVLAVYDPRVVHEFLNPCPICGNTENKKITIDT